MTTDPTPMVTGAMCCAPEHLNYLAVLACGAVNFVVGGWWYSSMGFGKAWMKAAKVNPRKANTANMGMLYAGWIATSFFMALSMAYLLMLTHAGDATSALRAAWTVWLGFTCASAAGDYLALQRGWTMYAINMGQYFVIFSLNALILTAWW